MKRLATTHRLSWALATGLIGVVLLAISTLLDDAAPSPATSGSARLAAGHMDAPAAAPLAPPIPPGPAAAPDATAEVERRTGRVDLVREAGTSCRGRVVDDLGAGVAGAVVEAQVPSASEPLTALCDARGDFFLAALPGARASLTTRARGHQPAGPVEVEWTPGREVSVTLTAARGGRVVGRVLDARARGFAGVRVEGAREGAPRVVATTDAAGRYDLDGLAPGAWLVRAVCPGHAGAHEGPLRVDAGSEIRVADLVLGAGAPVVGRVVSSDGSDARGLRVEYRVAGSETWDDHVVTGADGAFTLHAGPGPLEVRARGAGFDDGAPVAVEVTPAGASGLLLRVTRRVVVEGLVVDPAGEPVAGAWLLALGEPDATSQRTDARGRFALQVGAPAREVLVHAPGRAPARLTLGPGAENRVVLAPATAASGAGLDLLLTRGGAPLAHVLVAVVPVRADDAPDRAAIQAVATDDQGRAIVPVPAGPFELAAVLVRGRDEHVVTRRVDAPLPSLTWEVGD